MDKILEYHYGDHNSEVLTLLHPSNLSKTAGYAEDVVEFIETLTKRPGKTYALVNAMSAGEFYGSNRNGDYFPRKALEQYHKTFESSGYVYKHHINKDPRKSMGRVVFSYYHPKMNRVELVLELDDKKAAPVITRLSKGELPAVSMGCKVPYDVCSICGNRAKTISSYCGHLKNEMNSLMDDGRRVCAVNTMPKFFDISVVTIPADRTAGFLSKVASHSQVMPSAKLAEQVLKSADLEANGAIKKKITSIPSEFSISKDPSGLIEGSQGRIPDETLKELAKHGFSKSLSTMLSFRMFPKRADFQKLALYSLGLDKLANKLESKGVIFESNGKDSIRPEEVSYYRFDEPVSKILVKHAEEVSLTKPLIISRAMEKYAKFPYGNKSPNSYGISNDVPGAHLENLDLEALRAILEEYGLLQKPVTPESEVKEFHGWKKQPEKQPSQLRKILFGWEEEPVITPHKNPIGPLLGLGALYTGYAKLFNSPSSSGFAKIVARHPWLMPLLAGAGTVGSLAMQDAYFTKTASKLVPSMMVSVPLSYFLAGKAEAKIRRGEAISKMDNFIRKHPFITGLGMAGAVSTGVSMVKRAKVLSQLDNDSLNGMFEQLTS